MVAHGTERRHAPGHRLRAGSGRVDPRRPTAKQTLDLPPYAPPRRRCPAPRHGGHAAANGLGDADHQRSPCRAAPDAAHLHPVGAATPRQPRTPRATSLSAQLGTSKHRCAAWSPSSPGPRNNRRPHAPSPRHRSRSSSPSAPRDDGSHSSSPGLPNATSRPASTSRHSLAESPRSARPKSTSNTSSAPSPRIAPSRSTHASRHC